MPCTSEHGGDCCGITHIFDFDGWDDEDYPIDRKKIKDILNRDKEKIKTILDDVGADTHLLEIVLVYEQLITGRIKLLRSFGFKEVTRFKNSNSGNICRVYHLVTGEGPRRKR